MEYYSAIKKVKNAICSNMDSTKDYHNKWSKSGRERQLYITSIKNIKTETRAKENLDI